MKKTNQKVKNNNMTNETNIKKSVTFTEESTESEVFPPAIAENPSTPNKENQGVPLNRFGEIRILNQENGCSCLECFMCCSPIQTIFLPKLNETVKIVCINCENGMLKYGVMYRACPIFKPDTRELFICSNCNYVYSPTQIESILSNQTQL